MAVEFWILDSGFWIGELPLQFGFPVFSFARQRNPKSRIQNPKYD